MPGPQLGHAPGPASCRESYLVLESLLDAARDALEVKTDDVLLDRALDVLDHKALAVDVLGSEVAVELLDLLLDLGIVERVVAGDIQNLQAELVVCQNVSTCRLTSSPVIHLRQRSVLMALTSSVWYRSEGSSHRPLSTRICSVAQSLR